MVTHPVTPPVAAGSSSSPWAVAVAEDSEDSAVVAGHLVDSAVGHSVAVVPVVAGNDHRIN